MTSAPALSDLAQDTQAAETAAYEQQVTDDAVGPADHHLAETLAAAAALWVTAFGDIGAVGTGTALAELLRRVAAQADRAMTGLGVRAQQVLSAALPHAVSLGARHAREFVAAATRRTVRPRVGTHAAPREATVRVARGLAAAVDEQLARSARLLTVEAVDGHRFSAVAAGLAVARSAISRVRAAVAWSVNDALRTGTDAVAAALGLRRVWASERSSCVRCQAYAGQAAVTGGTFQGGRSWDPQQQTPGAAPVDGPPLHPYCRCRLVLWSSRWRLPGEQLPQLLERQAREAVGRGWSLPSESGAARVRAARALLASGAPLPPGVADAARAALRAGQFRDRTSPSS